MIRGKRVLDAQAILDFIPKGATGPIKKTLNSAVASAKNNLQADESNLYISKISVDEGPKFKRFRPRARGRAFPIQKKTSHIVLELDEITQDVTRKPAKSPKGIQAGPPQSSEAGLGGKERTIQEKPRFRPERDTAKARTVTGVRRMFRRIAI